MKSLAQPAPQSTTEDLEHVSAITRRVLRGRALYEERFNEIEHVRGNAWVVPSGNLLIGTYIVRLGNNPSCECRDFEHRNVSCKHVHAASIAHAKSSPCSCCGHRVLNRSLSEVTEDDTLLGWFVGDLICADCIAGGYWS